MGSGVDVFDGWSNMGLNDSWFVSDDSGRVMWRVGNNPIRFVNVRYDRNTRTLDIFGYRVSMEDIFDISDGTLN